MYRKHHPPSLFDEVWRLEKIGKDGAFHKRLNWSSINTVKDFLTHLHVNSSKLRQVSFHLPFLSMIICAYVCFLMMIELLLAGSWNGNVFKDVGDYFGPCSIMRSG